MQPWHNFSVSAVTQHYDTNPETGLTAPQVRDNLRKYGQNILNEEEKVCWWQMLWQQFASVLILILVVAAGLSFFLGDIIDALAILAIILLNGLLGFFQEWKAETALKNLKKMLNLRCTVLRDAQKQEIDAQDIVPGDIALLESGNIVPADIRLMETVNLKVDESSLTGESVPIEKSCTELDTDSPLSERINMVYAGTHIVNGHANGIAVATGMQTEFGKIAGLTGKITETRTRLQRHLSVLGRQLAVLALLIAGAAIVIGLLWGKPLVQMLMAGVSLAVAAVPEGLPAVVTITLALGVGIMARRKALLRHLQAAETLGAVSVICTDKTGTLTKNEMTIQKIWLPNSEIQVDGSGYEPIGAFRIENREISPLSNEDLKVFLETSMICNHAEIVEKDGRWQAIGSPTEAAFITAAKKAGLNPATKVQPCCEFSFNSERKRMSVVVSEGDTYISYIKGAPEVILGRSDKILCDGQEMPLDASDRKKIEVALLALAKNGLRTLALARKKMETNKTPNENEAETGLTFLGLAGIIDPPRPEVADAITKTQTAGISVLMMTGDSADTAQAVAQQIGLPAKQVITGPDIKKMDDVALGDFLQDHVIFARTVPEDKYRIVKLLQTQGHLVAMTGDGINDAPALKQADIGIAMGIRGTDVAKGAADMVLTDDNFASIVGAVEEGRRQYANISKFVRYLTSSNIGETLAIFMNILLGLPLILLPIQILWVNLVTDSATALSLSFEKAERNIMDLPPRALNKPILDRKSFFMLGIFGSYIAISVLGLFLFYLELDPALANSVAFTAMVVLANIHALNFRSMYAPLSSIGWFSNLWLLAAIGFMLVLQFAAVYLPPLQQALHTAPLAIDDWALIIGFSAPLFIGTEIYKTASMRRRNA